MANINEKSTVAIVPCDSYDEEKVYVALSKGVELIGGIESLIDKNERILVKPNLLSASDPSKIITTNPSVFDGVLRYLREKDYANIKYGDSPAGVYKMENVVTVTKLKERADKYNVELGDFEHFEVVDNPEGKVANKFPLCKGIIDSHAIISVSKMKTHALENITGAIKNQYGCIYSSKKALGHAKYPSSESFAKYIVELNLLLKPRLFIMDGIVAMEGNGPASGDPVPMKVLLFSTDPVALDSVFARLINLRPDYVPTNVIGNRYKLGTMDFNKIDVVTPDGSISIDEAYKKYGKSDFNVNRKKPAFWVIRRFFRNNTKKKHKPIVDPNLCVACGQCQEACPVEGKAVHSGNGKKAEYDYKKCIRCYCCQEICPVKAISRQDD